MTCRNCKSPVLDGKLICPRCVAEQSYKAMLAIQVDFLPQAIRDWPPFRLARRSGHSEIHIEMLGWKGQAFCGVVFTSESKKKKEWTTEKRPYSKFLDMVDLCPQCREMLAGKVKEIAA